MGEEEIKKEEEVKETKQEQEKKKSGSLRIVFTSLAIIIFGIIAAISLRAEYLNIREINVKYTDVFFQNMKNSIYVMIVIFIIVYILVYISNKFIKRGLRKFFEEENKQIPKLPNKSLCIVMALVASIVGYNMLTAKFGIFANAALFGETDPIFGTDIGYYIFTLPFIESILLYMIGVFVALIAYTGIYYIVSLNTYFDGVDSEILKKNTFVKQVVSLLTIIAIVVCIYIYISSQNILTQNMITLSDEAATELIGAGKTDVTIKLWGYRILSVAIIISVLLIIKYMKNKNYKKLIASAAIVPIYLIGMFVVMMYFQFVYVKTNEFDLEKEYIGYNIRNTRKAYGINVGQEGIENYTTITREEINAYQEEINNIPIINEDIIARSIEEQQENSVYYSYENSMISTYKLNADNTLIYITPREVLNDSSISYNNRTFIYTHGYGAVVSSATEVDENGYINYITPDFSDLAEIGISNPRIYFGLQTNSIAITDTSFGKEYDYPITATTYEEYVYNGKAGMQLGFFDRLVLAIENKDFKLAFSSYVNKDTKILTNRNIIQRAKKILPNIIYDDNPYLVVTDEGRLVWVIDGYTKSSAYPYSQTTTVSINGNRERINYIRNSVKVLIDAYDGTTEFYITDRTDPIIMTYRNMYPDLFMELEENIPDDIQRQLVYPKFLYQIQARMMNIYHDISEDALYRADDIWQITTKSSMRNSVIAGAELEPYYTMLKPVNKDPQMGLVITYNKLLKRNITAYLIGTIENGNSKLSLYKFSSENNVPSIVQLNAQIEEDATISTELEALDITGTRLIRNMIIVPINNTLIYVEPIYQVMLNETGMPMLKKVIVASGNRVAIGNSLSEALTNLFNDYAVDLEFIDLEDIESLVNAVIKANNNLTDSLNASNFEMIGRDISSLQNLIKQLETVREIELKKLEELEKEEARNRPTVELETNKNINTNTFKNELVNDVIGN